MRKIFFDGEFTKLALVIDFLSLAFITEDGHKLYLEIQQDLNKCDPWVQENVVPYLNQTKITEGQAKEKILDFIKEHYGEDKPVLVADVNQFDWLGICKLFGVWNIPFFYIPIDFSTLLFTKSIDIDISREQLAQQYNVDISKFHKHNAMCDCEVMFQLYKKLA